MLFLGLGLFQNDTTETNLTLTHKIYFAYPHFSIMTNQIYLNLIVMYVVFRTALTAQKQPSRGVLRKRKGFRKICSKFTGEHPCRRVILIKLPSNFIEITPWHACSPVNLLHIFRASFPRNASGGMLLQIFDSSDEKDLGQTSCFPNFKGLLL